MSIPKSLTSHSTPSNHKLVFCESLCVLKQVLLYHFSLDSPSLSLSSLSVILSQSLHVAANSIISFFLIVVQSLSRVQLFVTPWTVACQVSLSFTISRSLLKLMSIELVMPCNHLIFCCPLLLLPSVFPSIRVFSSKLALCIRWPKYWSFSFIISPFNKYSGLISFRIDWFDLLAVQGILKSLFQSHDVFMVRKHQFFDAQPFLLSISLIHARLLEKS